MHSFENEFLHKQPLPHSLVRTLRLLGEYKGKEDLFKKQIPQSLETLRQVAVIQSAESSNRIEGIEAPRERIKKLMEKSTRPKNRSEQEIAGYRDVLATIHANHEAIPFTPSVVLQFHRDLYRFTPTEGGRWKMADNDIREKRPDGTEFVRFKPTSAHQTPDAMDRLHLQFEQAWISGEVDTLLLIPAYVLDFLCIHPFTDGNGRMARLLTLLLMYRGGFDVGRYISLEQLIESQRTGYYDALYKSSQSWHAGKHSLLPWWEYFLGVMLLGAYRNFESRTGELTSAHGAKTEQVLAAIRKMPKSFKYVDLAQASPSASRPTIKRVLSQLQKEGKVKCVKPGRDAEWVKTGA